MPVGHGLEADRLQRRVEARVKLTRRAEFAPLHGAENVGRRTLVRWLTGQQAIKRRSQAIDVRPRTKLVDPALGLLGAHVGRSAQGAAG